MVAGGKLTAGAEARFCGTTVAETSKNRAAAIWDADGNGRCSATVGLRKRNATVSAGDKSRKRSVTFSEADGSGERTAQACQKPSGHAVRPPMRRHNHVRFNDGWRPMPSNCPTGICMSVPSTIRQNYDHIIHAAGHRWRTRGSPQPVSLCSRENLMLQCAGKENEPCAAASELILLTRSPRKSEADALSLMKR